MSTMTRWRTQAARELGATSRGALIGPQDAQLRRRARRLQRHDRPPAGADRTLRRRRRRRGARSASPASATLPSPSAAAATTAAASAPCDDGVVLDLSPLKHDRRRRRQARTVRVGGGCTWGEVDARHRTSSGWRRRAASSRTTGVGGLTLGGGIGHLPRKLRPDHRQPARGRGRPGRRLDRCARQRRREPRPVLGAARRRRQLRRRDRVHVPAAPGLDRAWPARRSGRSSRRRRCCTAYREFIAGGAARAERLLRVR